MDKLVRGDKVLVLPRIGGPEKYIGPYIDEMLSFENKIAVVRSTLGTGCKLDIDNTKYFWDSKALLKLESDSNSINKEPLNQKNYVVKLQRTKASVRRAEVPKGNRVCSKVHKTAISSQPLSYSVCIR